MRKVIKDQKQEVVELSKVSKNKFYGTIIDNYVCLAQLRKYDSEYYQFNVLSSNNLNYYSNNKTETLKSLIELLRDSDCQVFEFDTIQEFMSWALKQYKEGKK